MQKKKQLKKNELKAGSLRDWIALTRAEHALIVAFAVIASEFVVSKKFAWEMLFSALGPALITLGAFAWNDFFGVKTDSALKRFDRPLVSGKMGTKAAFYAAIVLISLGVLLTLFVNQNAFLIASAFALASMLYDPFLKKIPLAGNAFIASSMGVSFLYGNFVVAGSLNYLVLLFIIISFTAGLGRELVLTLRDVEGDKKIGAKTLPMLIGPFRTVVFASALFHVAVVLSLLPLSGGVSFAYWFFVAVTGVLFLLSAWAITFNQTQLVLRNARNYTLWGLLSGVAAFASLGL